MGLGELPFWRRKLLRSTAWQRILGTNPYLSRQIRYGILDMPSVQFTAGVVIRIIPQTEMDNEFPREDIQEGLQVQIYVEITPGYVH